MPATQIVYSGFDRIITGLRARLSGPGGLYNIGNIFGLITSFLAFWLRETGHEADAWGVFIGYFTSSPSAVALTIAMIIFFWSGEMYHRAWATSGPDAGLVRLADIGSGIGAIMLGLGLLILNQPVLAATAGALHAAGKFGSAYATGRGLPFWPAHWPDAWRTMVIASRVPPLFAATFEITRDLVSATPIEGAEPAALVVCYILWARADIMLFK